MTLTTDIDAKAQIAQAIEATGVATAADYDLGAILDEAFTFDMPYGYRQTGGAPEFWAAVERHAL